MVTRSTDVLSKSLLSALVDDLSLVVPSSLHPLLRGGAEPPPDATTREYACLALRRSLFKKLIEGDPTEAQARAALDKTLAVNRKCGDWRLEPNSSKDEELLGAFDDALYRFFCDLPPPSHDVVFGLGKLGSGSNRFVRRTDLYTKLWASPLSVSDGRMLEIFNMLVVKDPTMSAAEKRRADLYGSPRWAHARMSFVPKNVDTARSICTEPTVNMWFQLGLGNYLRIGLKKTFGIDLENQQQKNRDLARLGSETGDLATLDLESASDSISLGLLRRFFPRSFVSMVELYRSAQVELPDGNIEELHMVSGMGNGFTFPLQTLVFCCVVKACYTWHGIPCRRSGGNWGVFGDDIIVEKATSRDVARLLSLLGCTVNTTKSFVEGPFRESCGGDYHLGVDVRGVYLKSLRTPQSLAIAVNTLNRWSARHGIPIPRTVQALLCHMGPYHTVPYCESDDAGVKVPQRFHRGRRRMGHGFTQYNAWVVSTLKLVFTNEDLLEPRLVGSGVDEAVNVQGSYLAFLLGAVRSSTVIVRQRSQRYVTKRRVTSVWEDACALGRDGCHDPSLLDAAITMNLSL